MNDMVHIIFQHQWKLGWKLATTSKNLTKVCSPPSPGGEHTFLTWILICCQVACNLFLAGCNMVLFIFFPICNIASFVERRLSLPDTILSLQVTLGIQKSNQQDGQLEALGVFWRSGGLLSAFIEKITITARWRWSAGAYISRPINFCRNKLLSLDSPFSGKFPNKNHFLCNFQRDEEACMEIIGAIELVKAWQASKPAVFEGGWVMVFQDHLSCTSDDKNDQFWWSRSEYILNTTTDGVLIGRSRSFHCQRGELCYCGTQVC